MFRLIPAPLQRALMPMAHALRHRWRVWRKTPLHGVAVIISDLDGAVLLLRHSYGPDSWALPGGGLKRGEDPLDAARREVREELGMDLGRTVLVGTMEETLSGSPHTCYVVEAHSDAHPQVDRREVIEARFFPRHSLPDPIYARSRERLAFWSRAEGSGAA